LAWKESKKHYHALNKRGRQVELAASAPSFCKFTNHESTAPSSAEIAFDLQHNDWEILHRTVTSDRLADVDVCLLLNSSIEASSVMAKI
jgi:hypothetical protein